VVLVYAGLAAFGAHRHGLGSVLSAGVIALSVADAAIALGLFGSIFLAMGAASSELKDAQGWMTPVMVVLMLPLLAISHLLHSPDGALAVGLSLFPLTAPLILPIRISLGSMPAWQIALSVCGTLAFTLLSIWAAGRVFRIGILAQGRAPRLGELYRWIRHG
jgi:ABC-2 type transport system permease protein